MGLRAMFSAITGLQSHSTWLDVIGNNVANVNTVAYKSSRVTFSDAISQTMYSGSSPSTSSNLGGVNPQQVGLGSRVSSIQTLFNPGPVLQTGNATDIAINGNGFLVVQKGDQTYYTRAGNLTFDGDGNLVDANGGLVQGYQARIEYQQDVFNSNSSFQGAVTGNPAVITRAQLVLDTSNTSLIGNIQIKSGMTLPPRATSIMNFRGNLDSFLQVSDAARGGVFDLMGLPLGVSESIVATFNTGSGKAQGVVAGAMMWMDQLSDLTAVLDPNTGLPAPVLGNGVDLTSVRNNAGNYAWETGQVPAHTMVQTVYDSLGNPREVTILLYQVNDIGDEFVASGGTMGNDPTGPCQTAYAWYAFETTGGQTPDTLNLVGGTAIREGDTTEGWGTTMGFDRGLTDAQFCGDLLYFNTDGSLASLGGVAIGGTGPFTAAEQTEAYLYLPARNFADPVTGIGTEPASPLPTIGAEVMQVRLDFGTAGILTDGRRDGLYSDAAGSYQMINGVNTYIPNHSAFCESQDGYTEGLLQGVSFDSTGIIQGKFTTSIGDQYVALGQVVMARVANPEGLGKVGSNYYSSSNNSGPIFVGLAGQNGLGFIEGYSLEGSNVDLTVELSNMIIAQRGFEVNARSISTTNETLNTLVNLGR